MRELVAAVGQGPTHGRSLTREEARFALKAMMDGVATPAQAGALLLLQRYRGESADELLGYARAVRGRGGGLCCRPGSSAPSRPTSCSATPTPCAAGCGRSTHAPTACSTSAALTTGG